MINGKIVTNGLDILQICCTFVRHMEKAPSGACFMKDMISSEYLLTLKVRIVSCAFVILALCAFKPFGLDVWQWQAYIHLLAIFVLGICVCMLSDVILRLFIKGPSSSGNDASVIIKRNLWFQIINTPLIALMICLYRHFVLSDRVESNLFSWGNYLETLIIIAFCSFAIGLYWRFKYRNRYLAQELEETRLLNEQLQKLQKEAELDSNVVAPDVKNDDSYKVESEAVADIQQTPSHIVLTGTTSDSIGLDIADFVYVEAVGNYVKVYHLKDGQMRNDMLRATLKQIEEELKAFHMIVRCHRAFLVNLRQVKQIVSKSGSMQLLIRQGQDSIPVSRSNVSLVKEALKGI